MIWNSDIEENIVAWTEYTKEIIFLIDEETFTYTLKTGEAFRLTKDIQGIDCFP